MTKHKFFKSLIPIGLIISAIGYFGMNYYEEVRPREYLVYKGDFNNMEKVTSNKKSLPGIQAMHEDAIIEENYIYTIQVEKQDWLTDILSSALLKLIDSILPSSCDGNTPAPIPNPTPQPPPPGSGHQERDWGHQKIQASESWQVTRGSKKVCVIDTGIDLSHSDLPRPIIARNFTTSNASDVQDRQGHGTHVSGIILALDNSHGTIGACPNCQLITAKALSDQGSGTVESIAQAIQFCADQGASVANLSLGSTQASQIMYQATQYAKAKGVQLIAAAGNAGNNQPNYPASFDTVISISATQPDEQLARFSTYGGIDYAAPGLNIKSTCMGNSHCMMSGTSMASPYASAVCALALSSGKQDCTNLGVQQIPGVYNPQTHGRGRIDATLSVK